MRRQWSAKDEDKPKPKSSVIRKKYRFDDRIMERKKRMLRCFVENLNICNHYTAGNSLYEADDK